MPNLFLAEAIRYFFPGLWAVFFLVLVQPSAIKILQERTTSIGFLLVVLVCSVGFYALYRSFLYDSLIVRIQDLLRRGPSNYRLFLRHEYGLSHAQAVQMFLNLRERYLRDRYSSVIQVRAANIHMIYMVGILSIPFAMWACCIKNTSGVILMTILSLICLIGAFVEDRRYEEMELGFIKSIPSQDRHKMCMDLFGLMPLDIMESTRESNREQTVRPDS